MTHCYITRHKKYIDHRIRTISGYVSLSDSPELLSQVIETITSDMAHNNALYDSFSSDEIHIALTELNALVARWDILMDGDIVGYIYQELQSFSKKKSKGQYFTPDDIVEYLTSTSLGMVCSHGPHPRVLDPACGSGQFLISLYRQILRNGTISQSEWGPRDIIKNCLYGFDIDPVAVKIARFNLMKISGCSCDDLNIYTVDFLYRDDLNFFNSNGLNIKYDLIIGNPPWRSRFTSEEKKYYRRSYHSMKSGINTFTLFIERSFDFLSDSGHLAFLIPEAYLNIRVHRSSREFILENSMIKNIAVWGEKFKGVFAPSVSIIVKKEEGIEERKGSIINITTNKNIDSGTATLIPQASYYRTTENIFNINYSRKAVNIISSIDEQDTFFLKGRAKFFLGIVTGNNSKYLSQHKSDIFPDPIITGRDVTQFNIKQSSNYFKFDPAMLQQVAPEELYTAREKILYKFIGKRLTFALDREGMYSLNNVNGFIQNFDDMNIETTLSILNSSIIQYYYEKSFFTLKVLRGNLEQIPIKRVNRPGQKRIKRIVEDIIGSTAYSDLQKQNLDDIIFHEYGIKEREAYLVTEGA